MLFLLCRTAHLEAAGNFQRYRDFDFNASRINYEVLRIKPNRGKFVVQELKLFGDDDTSKKFERYDIEQSQYLAEVGDQIVAVNGERVSTMSLREILRQPSGRFMLPLVEQNSKAQESGAEWCWQQGQQRFERQTRRCFSPSAAMAQARDYGSRVDNVSAS